MTGELSGNLKRFADIHSSNVITVNFFQVLVFTSLSVLSWKFWGAPAEVSGHGEHWNAERQSSHPGLPAHSNGPTSTSPSLSPRQDPEPRGWV